MNNFENFINESTMKIQDKTNSLLRAIKLVRGCEVDFGPQFNNSKTASYGQFAVTFYNIPIKGQGDHVHSLLTSFVKHALTVLNVMGLPMTLKPVYNKYESNQGVLSYEWTDSDGYKVELEASILEIDVNTSKPQNIVHYAVWVQHTVKFIFDILGHQLHAVDFRTARGRACARPEEHNYAQHHHHELPPSLEVGHHETGGRDGRRTREQGIDHYLPHAAVVGIHYHDICHA